MSDKKIYTFWGVFVKTARFMECCRRGLEGGFVRALIKNLVRKNKKGKAIRLFFSVPIGIVNLTTE